MTPDPTPPPGPTVGERYVEQWAEGKGRYCTVWQRVSGGEDRIVGEDLSREDAELLAHGRQRIERLEAALRSLLASDAGWGTSEYQKIRWAARAALAEGGT